MTANFIPDEHDKIVCCLLQNIYSLPSNHLLRLWVKPTQNKV